MTKIAQDHDVGTLINAFSCEPQNQQHLMDAWIRTTDERLGVLPGIISAALHRENLFRIGSEPGFREMARYAKPDAHLCEVCCLLDKTDQEGR